MADTASAPVQGGAPAMRGWLATRPQPVRALLIIAQPALAASVARALSHDGYLTRTVPDGAQARAALGDRRPHLAVIDLDLAGGRFLDALGDTAPGVDCLPVIALTGRGDLQTRLAAFDRGVDDVLTIPFAPEELAARARVIVRRTYCAAAPVTPALRLGDLELDLVSRRVRVRGEELHLSALEQGLLYLLAANAGRVVTRDEILDHLWGVDYTAESNVVDRHIRHLRTTLHDNWRRPRYIATVPGQGYRFVPPAADQARPASPA